MKKRDLYWIWNSSINRWALRYGEWKIVKYGREEPDAPADWNLYNLNNDPREKQNVASEHPDIIAKLHKMFLEQRKKDKAKASK